MKIMQIACLAGLVPSGLLAQTIVDSSTFYNPDFKVRRPGATSGVLSLNIVNTPVSQSMSSGNSSWTHSAGGFVQARTEVAPLGIRLALIDAQLAAYTETSGDSLVFGRELSATATLAGIPVINQGDAVNALLNDITGASVLYQWESDATMSGLAIAPGQLYEVNFTVTSGAGLPVNLLSASTFGITTAGVTGASNESAELLNLLGLVTLGENSKTGNFSFQFKSASALSSLDFNFAATTGVGVTALGGTQNNQNVLTFSGFEIVQVPEPSAFMLSTMSLGVICLLRRKRKES